MSINFGKHFAAFCLLAMLLTSCTNGSVSFEVKSPPKNRILVLGWVVHQGEQTWHEGMSLADAIAGAGGLSFGSKTVRVISTARDGAGYRQISRKVRVDKQGHQVLLKGEDVVLVDQVVLIH